MSDAARGGLADALAGSDQAARERARGARPEDRRGWMLVEASAGAGKTTVLLDRVLAYVESGERRLTEMAVVTFTDMAAAELRVRLRQEIARRLGRVAERGDAPGEPRRGRLRQGLADLEAAAVGTIHSFCLDLLRRRPIEAGVDPAFAVADPFAQRLLFAAAWEELLRGMPAEEPGLEAAVDLELASEPRLRALARDLQVHLGHPVHPVEGRDALPRPLAAETLDFERRWRDVLAEAGRGAALARPGSALSADLERARARLAELDALPARPRQRAFLEEEIAPGSRLGRRDEEGAKASRDRLAAALAELRADLVHQRLCELASWLARAGERYRAATQGAALLDFDQLVRRTIDLLRRHDAVLADFRRRYPIVLVDEFQDTDRWQIELVLLLAGEERGEDPDGKPRALFLVGDPKQSIYRFRGADLEGYARVRDGVLAPGARVALTRTFRLPAPIAAWVNEVMARVMAPEGDRVEPWEAAYEPLAAVASHPGARPPRPRPPRPPPPPEAGGVLYLDLAEPDPPRVGPARALEAEAFARLVRVLVEGDGSRPPLEVRDPTGEPRRARFGDVALLLPRMTSLERYEEACNRHQIPFRVVGGRHYYRRDEVHALLEILRALADPGDTVATVAALRGPGFGCSDRALMAYALCRPRPRLDALEIADAARLATSPEPAAASDVAGALAHLDRLRRDTRDLPLPDLVATVLERSGLLVFYGLLHRGEQRVANLLKAVEVARRVEAGGYASLPAFVRWLELLLDEEPEESDSPYLEGAEEAVRITTIHRAKGLEFPVVLLGGLPGEEAPAGGLRVLPREGGEGIEIQVRKGVGTRGAAAAAEAERRRERAEERRLLYVGLTRARDLLVLPRLPEGTRVALTPLYAELWGRGAAHAAVAPHRRLTAADLPPPPSAAARAPRLEDLLRSPPDPAELAARAAWLGRRRGG